MVMVTPKNKVYVTATVCFHTYASLFPTMVPKYLNQHVGFVFWFFFNVFLLFCLLYRYKHGSILHINYMSLGTQSMISLQI